MRKHAFTLIELLVVVAIIGMIVAVVLPALAAARSAASQARSLAALRQIMLGYSVYLEDFKQHVPFGYPNAVVHGVALEVTIPSGHRITGRPTFMYPVRLSPYVSDAWQIFYDQASLPDDPPTAADSLADAWLKVYKIGNNPAFGLNSVFVGGDKHFDGFGPAPAHVPSGRHVVFRAAQVRRPSELLVFTETRLTVNFDTDTAWSYHVAMPPRAWGYHLAMPPRARGVHWTVSAGRAQPVTDGLMGLPRGRFTASVPTAFFDGHVAAASAQTLSDMRHWANWADAPDYDFAPAHP